MGEPTHTHTGRRGSDFEIQLKPRKQHISEAAEAADSFQPPMHVITGVYKERGGVCYSLRHAGCLQCIDTRDNKRGGGGGVMKLR